jgi:alanyl-tRNA synthetase
LVNAKIHAADEVSWTEVSHASVKERRDVMQFFGDKYGDTVRVVQIGGGSGALNGYSMELCGGTHVRNTSAIGFFKIRSEGAVAAGVRRIEAVCGDVAWQHMRERVEQWDQDLKLARAKLDAANSVLAEMGEAAVTAHEFPHLMTAMLVDQADVALLNATFAHALRTLEETKLAAIEAEKRIQKVRGAQSAKIADAALAELMGNGAPIIISMNGDASLLQELLNGLKKRNFAGPAFAIVDDGDKLHLAVHCGPKAQSAGLNAGTVLRDLAAIAGGKGGGKADQARGAAPDRSKVESLKTAAAEAFGTSS